VRRDAAKRWSFKPRRDDGDEELSIGAGRFSPRLRTLLGCATDATGALVGCTESGFHTVFAILAAMLTVTGVIGWIWGPRTEGMSLEEIQEARSEDRLSV
jgi:hypothetical protein